MDVSRGGAAIWSISFHGSIWRSFFFVAFMTQTAGAIVFSRPRCHVWCFLEFGHLFLVTVLVTVNGSGLTACKTMRLRCCMLGILGVEAMVPKFKQESIGHSFHQTKSLYWPFYIFLKTLTPLAKTARPMAGVDWPDIPTSSADGDRWLASLLDSQDLFPSQDVIIISSSWQRLFRRHAAVLFIPDSLPNPL